MKKLHRVFTVSVLMMTGFFVIIGSLEVQADESAKEALGRALYFDENLSQPPGQSCASCHDPNFGFVDPDANLPVSEGVLPHRFGNRNSPSAAYAMYAPRFHYDEDDGLWEGGQFWDGRGTGYVLGDALADQALGPFLNPVEMANKRKGRVVKDVAKSIYANDFLAVWNLANFNDVDDVYDKIALSIAAFERTAFFAPFSSKYDAYLEKCLSEGIDKDKCAQGRGPAKVIAKAHFTKSEWRGMKLFMRDNDNNGSREVGEGAMCAACHVVEWEDPDNSDLENPVVVPGWSNGLVPPMFTDFTFDNLGVPKNTAYPLNPDPYSAPDLGLGVVTGDSGDNGKFKVMSLRNVGVTLPYSHNGFFRSLKELTHFYNTRDVSREWAEPEFPGTMNVDELGKLGLSDRDEDDLVAFMMTLSDGYVEP